jgi:uncharacterized protein YqjF (DUF2071 family)
MSVCDKQISSTHVTLFVTIANLSEQTPKYYAFWLVDRFGIFGPNLIGMVYAITVAYFMVPVMTEL